MHSIDSTCSIASMHMPHVISAVSTACPLRAYDVNFYLISSADWTNGPLCIFQTLAPCHSEGGRRCSCTTFGVDARQPVSGASQSKVRCRSLFGFV